MNLFLVLDQNEVAYRHATYEEALENAKYYVEDQNDDEAHVYKLVATVINEPSAKVMLAEDDESWST